MNSSSREYFKIVTFFLFLHFPTFLHMYKKLVILFSEIFNITFKQHTVDKQLLGSCKTLAEIENKIKHPSYVGSLQLIEIPGLSRFVPYSIVLGEKRTIYFASNVGNHFLLTQVEL